MGEGFRQTGLRCNQLAVLFGSTSCRSFMGEFNSANIESSPLPQFHDGPRIRGTTAHEGRSRREIGLAEGVACLPERSDGREPSGVPAGAHDVLEAAYGSGV